MSDRGPAAIRVQRRVEWSDTDASGYHHNTMTLRLIELAETTLLDRLGILEQVYGRMPRVHVTMDFSLPLKHKDLLDVHFAIAEVGRTSVTYEVRVEHERRTAATARVVVVLVDRAWGEPVAWSEEHRRLLLTAGPQAPELLVAGEAGS